MQIYEHYEEKFYVQYIRRKHVELNSLEEKMLEKGNQSHACFEGKMATYLSIRSDMIFVSVSCIYNRTKYLKNVTLYSLFHPEGIFVYRLYIVLDVQRTSIHFRVQLLFQKNISENCEGYKQVVITKKPNDLLLNKHTKMFH